MSADESDVSQDLTLPQEGEIIAGKYRIERVLGRGGMGVVVAAEHTTLRQHVAVKFLLPEAVARVGSVERFLREARAAVMIKSEHVARVFDVGTLESGSPYMVMELLSGSDLGEVLQNGGPLPTERAVDYVLQACEAIAEAHATGIIHRDLKPANLFLTSRADGSALVKVLDFGLSKPPKTDTLDASLTQANAIMGSPFYMSPEQIRGLKGLDSRADLWSLGVILYQLLTGARPFEAESLGALFLMIGADAPAPLRERLPDIPAALDAAVLRCLEKDISRRTQSVAALARELAPFGSAAAAVSVERISRLLPDSAARMPMSSQGDGVGVVGAAPVSSQQGGVQSSSQPSLSTQPPGASSSQPSIPEPTQALPAESAARSGSIQAVTQDEKAASSSASLNPSAPAPRRSRAPLVGFALATVLGLAVAGVALRPKQGGAPTADAATGRPALTAAPSASAPATPEIVPAPVVSATSAPAASASAASAPSASAPASASAAAAPATTAPKTVKPKVPTKKKDPLEKWQ